MLLWLAATALLLAALYALSVMAGRGGYENLLMVTPSEFGAPGLSPEKLEEFSEEEFLLTYEIRRPAAAQAVNSRHSVALVGTNGDYANIMGYPILDGGFFTKAAADGNNRHAVLGETAAYRIFGSVRVSGSTVKLNGETWIIAGVIRDNDDENANVYVPAGIVGGNADSLMVLTDDKLVTEAYAKNALKSLGVHESGYDFISLSASARAFGERFSVAWKSALSAALLLFIVSAGGGLREKLRLYRDEMRRMYPGELLARHRGDLLKDLGLLLLLAAGIGAILALSLQILGTCLTWRELAPITGELAAGDLGHKLLWLRDHQTLDRVLFGACVGSVLLCLILAPLRRARRKRSAANQSLLNAAQI